MPVDSSTESQDTPALAATAAAMIDAALVGSGLSREAYWAAVRKGYNTPYNDPPRAREDAARTQGASIAIVFAEAPDAPAPLPIAAMAVPAAVEVHAG
ncbi:hypothetical protein [uncultured Methylobacterium sp.]|uniref:hypothetical protein n=1 Tax=uncultured Methylobacterium sp. TaxID=157278 RepID=UPI0035CBDF53